MMNAVLQSVEYDDDMHNIDKISCKMKIVERTTIPALSSVCLFDICKYILIGSNNGKVFKIDWNGNLVAAYNINHQHSLYKVLPLSWPVTHSLTHSLRYGRIIMSMI